MANRIIVEQSKWALATANKSIETPSIAIVLAPISRATVYELSDSAKKNHLISEDPSTSIASGSTLVTKQTNQFVGLGERATWLHNLQHYYVRLLAAVGKEQARSEKPKLCYCSHGAQPSYLIIVQLVKSL